MLSSLGSPDTGGAGTTAPLRGLSSVAP
jgi:hypothetical protein